MLTVDQKAGQGQGSSLEGEKSQLILTHSLPIFKGKASKTPRFACLFTHLCIILLRGFVVSSNIIGYPAKMCVKALIPSEN